LKRRRKQKKQRKKVIRLFAQVEFHNNVMFQCPNKPCPNTIDLQNHDDDDTMHTYENDENKLTKATIKARATKENLIITSL
jgi:hypothetical protein